MLSASVWQVIKLLVAIRRKGESVTVIGWSASVDVDRREAGGWRGIFVVVLRLWLLGETRNSVSADVSKF